MNVRQVKKASMAAALLAAFALSGCVSDGYGSVSVGSAGYYSPYDYYDGYYYPYSYGYRPGYYYGYQRPYYYGRPNHRHWQGKPRAEWRGRANPDRNSSRWGDRGANIPRNNKLWERALPQNNAPAQPRASAPSRSWGDGDRRSGARSGAWRRGQ